MLVGPSNNNWMHTSITKFIAGSLIKWILIVSLLTRLVP